MNIVCSGQKATVPGLTRGYCATPPTVSTEASLSCSGRSSQGKVGEGRGKKGLEEDPATPSARRKKVPEIESSCGPELFVPPIYSLALYRQSVPVSTL